MLNFSSVTYRYDSELFEFDLTINQGDVIAVLGPSGAGKSTLLNLLAGFITPDSGDITLNGDSLLSLAPHLRPISILFQENNLFLHLSVADNMGLGISPSLKLNQAQKQRIKEAAEQVGIGELLERLPEQLSGGQKQRVALARCLLQNRPILLLDEPFSSLDPQLRKEMIVLVKKLINKQQLTVLMVTHHLDDAKALASHYVLVREGRIEKQQEIAYLS